MNTAVVAPCTILLLIDGLGLGPADPALNPVTSGVCPRLQALLREVAVPVDATMGVAGVPQSATGQTALLTGVNTARRCGRHVAGFPGRVLREVLSSGTLYDHLAGLGFVCTFANAYYVSDVDEVRQHRRQSVTTVAALQAFGRVRDTRALLRNEAVYHDLTRLSLRDRGYAGPLISPAEAAAHLMALARRHDLTLFEYFQTDRAGHAGDAAEIARVLGELDRFLAALLEGWREPPALLVLCSDHGNIESGNSTSHSLCPVPFVALGHGAHALRARVKSVLDVTPALVALYGRGVAQRGGHGKQSGT